MKIEKKSHFFSMEFVAFLHFVFHISLAFKIILRRVHCTEVENESLTQYVQFLNFQTFVVGIRS